jgi:hypothetical protein
MLNRTAVITGGNHTLHTFRGTYLISLIEFLGISISPGASGIGKAIATTLKNLGAKVVVGDLRKSEDSGVHSVICDVTNINDMQVRYPCNPC